MDTIDHVTAAPGPLPIIAAALGPLACPIHSARPPSLSCPQRSAQKNYLNLS